MDFIYKKIKTEELKLLIQNFGDLDFFNKYQIEFIEVNNRFIEKKTDSLTQIYIINSLPFLQENHSADFIQTLKRGFKTLSYYDLMSLKGWLVNQEIFLPLVRSQLFWKVNQDKRNNLLIEPTESTSINEYNDAEYSYCNGPSEIENAALIIKSFLCGCQPISSFPINNFKIPNLIINKNNIHEIISSPAPIYNNYFRGSLAEKYGILENFIKLENIIKNTFGE